MKWENIKWNEEKKQTHLNATKFKWKNWTSSSYQIRKDFIFINIYN